MKLAHKSGKEEEQSSDVSVRRLVVASVTPAIGLSDLVGGCPCLASLLRVHFDRKVSLVEGDSFTKKRKMVHWLNMYEKLCF